MVLQDHLLSDLMETMRFGNKIRNDSSITEIGKYALDATEKNSSVSGSLAASIKQLDTDLTTERLRINSLASSGTAASDGELVDIRIGIDGSTYSCAGDAVRDQIKNYRDVHIGTSKPTNKFTSTWIDTSPASQAEYFMVPEIKDDSTGSADTWSSAKIQSVIDNATKDVVVSDTQPSASNVKVWIDTKPASQAESFTIPEIKDTVTNSEDTWSSSKIRHEIDVASDDVIVGDTKPSGSSAKVWVDTKPSSQQDYFMVPEIRDDTTNSTDTWSSSKIQNAIDDATRDVYVGKDEPSAAGAKIWIDTNPSDSFWVPQIDDSMTSTQDTWSSSKIQEELTKIRRELGLETS